MFNSPVEVRSAPELRNLLLTKPKHSNQDSARCQKRLRRWPKVSWGRALTGWPGPVQVDPVQVNWTLPYLNQPDAEHQLGLDLWRRSWCGAKCSTGSHVGCKNVLALHPWRRLEGTLPSEAFAVATVDVDSWGAEPRKNHSYLCICLHSLTSSLVFIFYFFLN